MVQLAAMLAVAAEPRHEKQGCWMKSNLARLAGMLLREQSIPGTSVFKQTVEIIKLLVAPD